MADQTRRDPTRSMNCAVPARSPPPSLPVRRRGRSRDVSPFTASIPTRYDEPARPQSANPRTLTSAARRRMAMVRIWAIVRAHLDVSPFVTPAAFTATFSQSAFAEDPGALLTRGEYLVNVVAACGNCHTKLTPDLLPFPACISRAADASISRRASPIRTHPGSRYRTRQLER